MIMVTYLITGITSGLGLELARNLAARPDLQLITGARNPDGAADLKAAFPSDRLTTLPLDLASQKSVRDFSDAVRAHLGDQKLDGLICNAGLQFTGPQPLTDDGVELTFATNHLGHFTLVHKLLDKLAPGATVISTASGTHDPNEKLATTFGFRGAVFPSAEKVAVGDLDSEASDTQLGHDLYATSKLCNILFTREMAKRMPEDQARFIAFDPGLMPGTGLARARGGFQQWAWTYVLPLLRPIFGAARMSSVPLSAAAYEKVMLSAASDFPSGSYPDFTLNPATLSDEGQSDDLAADLYNVGLRLTGVQPA